MAPGILVVYHSAEGQTAKVATRIAERLTVGGAEVRLTDVDGAPEPAGFAAVVAGDSIHAGHHSHALSHWLTRHAAALRGQPFALFQVSLTSAATDPEHTAEAGTMARDLIGATGADPDLVGLFAGALAYTRYGWIKRRMMRSIARKGDLPTDTDQDHEFTDWDAVDHFADDVLALASAGG